MKFLDSKSSQVKPFDAPDVTPVLGVATFLPCRVSPSTEITLFDLPVICISIILSLLKEGEKKELRLVSLVARSIVEGLGIKKMEIINQRTFTLASRCTSLQIVELQASNDDDVVKMTSLAASLPLLDTLIIRIKAAGSPDCRGWRDRLLGSKRETTRAKYQPSPSVLLALFRSLDYHRRRGKPSPINTICHFPVGLVILTALNLKSDSCLSISLTETLEIASHVPLSRHVTLSEVKIDLQLTMAGTTSSICWPPRLKKLDIGFPQGLRPSNSGNDLVLSAITMGGLLSLTSSLEALVVRGEVILAPCIFKLFGQLVRLSSLTIWTKSWVEINNLSNLSLLPSLTSLQVRVG